MARKVNWDFGDGLVYGLAGWNQQKCEGKGSGHYGDDVGVWFGVCGRCW